MTKTDICNLALASLGHDRTISDYDTDTSTEAVRCRLFLPRAIATVFSQHNWDFAARETSLTLSWANSQGYASIVRPADCARLVAVEDEDENPLKIKQANGRLMIKTDSYSTQATIRYVSTDTDLDDWPTKFIDAVAAYLAYLLSGPMYGDPSKTNAYYQLAQTKVADAITVEADETAYKGETVNPFISVRD